MAVIELNQEQLEILTQSGGEAVLTNERGQAVGYVSPPLTPKELRTLEERADSDGPWYTTKEVVDHLESLDES